MHWSRQLPLNSRGCDIFQILSPTTGNLRDACAVRGPQSLVWHHITDSTIVIHCVREKRYDQSLHASDRAFLLETAAHKPWNRIWRLCEFRPRMLSYGWLLWARENSKTTHSSWLILSSWSFALVSKVFRPRHISNTSEVIVHMSLERDSAARIRRRLFYSRMCSAWVCGQTGGRSRWRGLLACFVV